MTKFRFLTKAVVMLALGGLVALVPPHGAQAQTEVPASGPATRFPAQGLAILDCAPAAPAPGNSCILRVPPNRTLEVIEKREIADKAATFDLVRDLSKIAPDLRLSKTMVLIDLTPGLRSERRPSWARERALIASLIESLPASEPIALYGFNAGLERLTDFTTDRAALAQVIGALDLRGTNTRIATNARDAIALLGEQKDVVLRHLIVVSDGEEEGTRALAEVAAAAVAHGVTVSTFGTFWRPVGAPQNGAGLDYLAALSEGALGATGGAVIARPDEARAAVKSFAAAVGGAISGSALIVAREPAAEADIIAVLNKPRPGEAGVFDQERVTARFVPTQATATPPADQTAPTPDPAPEEVQPWYNAAWLGLPVLWWLIGAGTLISLAVLGAVLALSRARGAEPAPEPLPLPGGEPFPTPPPVAPQLPAAIAFLVRDDTGDRLAIRKARVTLGRSETCDVVVSDISVSRLHAELERRGAESFALTDSGSLNKTRVNGKVITEARVLKPGDVIGLGDVKLRFTLA